MPHARTSSSASNRMVEKGKVIIRKVESERVNRLGAELLDIIWEMAIKEGSNDNEVMSIADQVLLCFLIGLIKNHFNRRLAPLMRARKEGMIDIVLEELKEE